MSRSLPSFLRPAIRIAGLITLLVLGLPNVALATFEHERGWETVTIEGREFPAAFQVSVRQLTLWRLAGGTLQPIPFQIDERDRNGELALPEGPQPSHDESPGVFDDNDLLVFAARDLGEQGIVAGAAEIRITDPVTGASRWAYLRVGVDTPAAGSDAVTYDAGTDTVHTRRYSLTLGPNVPSGFAFTAADGTPGRNLLDRLKARVTAKILWGLLQFRRDETDVTTTVLAWKEGPIRIIRRSELSIRLGYGLPQPKIVAEDCFTADTFEGPVIVRLPFDLRYVFGDLIVRIFLDFENLQGYRLLTEGHEAVPLSCEQPQPDTKDMAGDWFGMTGPEGTFVHVQRMSPTLETLHRSLYAVADRTPDPPERVPGNCPGVGYMLTGWGGVGRGTHEMSMTVRAFEDFAPGDELTFVRALQHPLVAGVMVPTP